MTSKRMEKAITKPLTEHVMVWHHYFLACHGATLQPINTCHAMYASTMFRYALPHTSGCGESIHHAAPKQADAKEKSAQHLSLLTCADVILCISKLSRYVRIIYSVH